MKKIGNILLNGCAYSILILFLFYLFAVISGISGVGIAFSKFILIVFFGFLIALTNLIFDLPNIKLILKYLIHYSVLLTAFSFIFLLSDSVSGKKTSFIFVCVFIFTVLYAAVLSAVLLIKRMLHSADKRPGERTKEAKEKTKSVYKPIYTDDDI